jgi:hypothetical protein
LLKLLLLSIIGNRNKQIARKVCDWWDRLKQNEATLFCDLVRQDSRPSRLTLICLIPIFAGTQCSIWYNHHTSDVKKKCCTLRRAFSLN